MRNENEMEIVTDYSDQKTRFINSTVDGSYRYIFHSNISDIVENVKVFRAGFNLLCQMRR